VSEQLPAEPLNLPAAIPGGEVEADVLDGEIVEEPQRPVYVLRPVVNVFQTITVIAGHPVPRTAARHAAYVPAGVVVAWRRWRHARQRPERMMQQAETTGDHAQVIAWRQQLEAERQNRHGRMVKTAETIVSVARTSVWIIGGTIAALAALGVLLAFKWGLRGFLWPWETAAAIAVFAVSLVAALWFALAGTAALVALALLYRAGRRGGGDLAPRWARTAAEDDVDPAIDEAAITQALKQLRIPQITDYLKLGQPLPYIVPCRQEGRGTYAEIRLPNGLPALEIAKQARRERLAASLYRHTKEVWPTTGADNSVLKLWVADKGALDEGAGPYPLLAEGFTDVFKGFPFGRTLRGDPIKIPVMGRNTLCGGAPEQGKSNGARVVASGYALDVITEIRIYVPDANFDFERFKPRCSSYVMGAEDEWIEQISGELEELKDEIQRRGQLLIDAEQEEVTYALAHAGVGLHPMFVLLEEAHVAIQHRKYGKDITQLLIDIVKLDRKRAVHLMLSTQAPTKDSMPRDVTRNCTNGIAYAVGDYVANDALLGQGAYRSGHRATELIPGEDRGTALCKGFSGERSEMVQAYRVSGRSGDDQVTPIVNRALAAMAEQGRPVPGTERGPLAIVSRDLLDDLAEVTSHRSGRVRVSELPDLLHNLAPSWGEYRGLTGVRLRKLLFAAGVPTTNPGNVPTLDLDDLAAAVAKRDQEVS
jgi:S-DNA-T family DNA segregation ATPase FtsK/SpoIIIE